MNPVRKFDVISNDLPAPPYPADIRAKGMGLYIDHERMKQSTAWVLCPLAMWPWLVMLWIESWVSAPCGTYVNDDEVIAARIGMDFDLFQLHRKHLMRGWFQASDGLLYHGFIAELVLGMTESRRKDRERMAAHRAGKRAPESGEVAGVSRVTPAKFTAGSGTGTGTGTGPGTNTAPRQARRASPAATVSADALVDLGVERQAAEDWLLVRKRKGSGGAPLTKTALALIQAEALKAGLTLGGAVAISAANNWVGFKAAWTSRPDTLRPTTAGKQSAIEARNAQVAADWANRSSNDA